MPSAVVRFHYEPGLERHPFSRVRLAGSWGQDGAWIEAEMQADVDAAGRPAFSVEIAFADDVVGKSLEAEVLNSDLAGYGGWQVGNGGRDLLSGSGTLELVLPASGFVVARRQS